MRSIALLRATLTSQARGLLGGSDTGQRSSATAKASCRTSSARSKSPTRRISVASARPASLRNVLSISAGVMRIQNYAAVLFFEHRDQPVIWDALKARTWKDEL